MKKRRWCSAVAGLALVAGLSVGCGKKTDPTESSASQPASADPKSTAKSAEPATVSTAKISGAQEVMAALDKKDYDGAIAALLRIRQSVSTAEQQVQFATLADEVRIKLLDASPTQPKAAEALTVLRRITGGR
jgi:hypothetical protein